MHVKKKKKKLIKFSNGMLIMYLTGCVHMEQQILIIKVVIL